MINMDIHSPIYTRKRRKPVMFWTIHSLPRDRSVRKMDMGSTLVRFILVNSDFCQNVTWQEDINKHKVSRKAKPQRAESGRKTVKQVQNKGN